MKSSAKCVKSKVLSLVESKVDLVEQMGSLVELFESSVESIKEEEIAMKSLNDE